MPHSLQSSCLPHAVSDAMAASRASRPSPRFARWVLACLLAAGATAASAASTPPAAPPDAPRPPRCADQPVPPAIAELALPADQLARVTSALRAACERDQQAHEENHRALAALLSPEQMHRVEGRLRPPPPPAGASAPCRPERDAGPAGR